MGRFDEYTPIKLHVENIWYSTFNNIDNTAAEIQKWEKILATDEYYIEKYQRAWTYHISDFEKANLKRRMSCLMRILILRAQNIVVEDFEGFANKFYKPGRNLTDR